MGEWDREQRHEENRNFLESARAGDGDASWKLILNHEPLIRSEIAKVVTDSRLEGDRQEQGDAWSHEVMLLARDAFHQFDGDYPQFSHWIRTIGRNHVLREVKREQRRQQRTSAIDEPANAQLLTTPGADTALATRLDLEERELASRALRECLHRLKAEHPDLHELIWMQYKRGLSQAQMQKALADRGDFISAGAVGKRVDKGRRTLGVCIRDRMRNG